MRDKYIFDLLHTGLIGSEFVFACDNCTARTTIQCAYDEWEASEAAYDSGWRSGRTKAYCPKCAKKKLKTK